MLDFCYSKYLYFKEFVVDIECKLFNVPKSTNYLIIGCSSGIGYSLCIALVTKNPTIGLVLASRKYKELNKLKSKLLSINPNANILVRPFDITHFNDASALLNDAHKSIGPIDTIVVNSGIFDLHHLYDADYAIKSESMLHTNLYGPISVIHAFCRYIQSHSIPQPYLVVVSSISSCHPFYNAITYSTSKQCLEFVINHLYGPSSLTTTIIKPGYVFTKLTEWTKSIPFPISQETCAMAMLQIMHLRSNHAIIPWFPYALILPFILYFTPTFIMNLIIKHEFNINTSNNEQGITALRNHIYNIHSHPYAIIKEIGSGSYGTVYKALNTDTGIIVALKKVDGNEVTLKEIEFMTSCTSDYIIALEDYYMLDTCLYIAMEYCEAGSILDILKHTKSTLTDQQLGSVMRDALLGLQYLHKRFIIHRDIKAGNLLINKHGRVKLSDFGVSANMELGIKKSTVIGTPYWMAPEIIQEIGYGVGCDIWALGITAIECLDGSAPYANIHPMRAIFMIPSKPSPTRKQPELSSAECNLFIQKCLEKNADIRVSCDELLKHDSFIKNALKEIVMVELVEKSILHGNMEQKELVAEVMSDEIQSSTLKASNITNEGDVNLTTKFANTMIIHTSNESTIKP